LLAETTTSNSISSKFAERNIHDPQNFIRRISAFFPQEKPKTGKRRNLGTFRTRKAAEAHERAVQYFKKH